MADENKIPDRLWVYISPEGSIAAFDERIEGQTHSEPVLFVRQEKAVIEVLNEVSVAIDKRRARDVANGVDATGHVEDLKIVEKILKGYTTAVAIAEVANTLKNQGVHFSPSELLKELDK